MHLSKQTHFKPRSMLSPVAAPRCCPPLSLVLERFVDTALVNSDGTLVPSLWALFERVARIANARVLQTDMFKEKFRMTCQAEGYTDIGDMVGPLASLLQALAYTLKIPVPTRTRQHLKLFGDKYTVREPTDPFERARWSNRYVAMRMAGAGPAAQATGEELAKAKEMKNSMLENEIKSHIQCAACQKLEDPDEGELLRKCSRCKLVFYCSRTCETAHWPSHKKTCKKVSRFSLPERLLTMEESINRGHAKATAGGNILYPCKFAVWLDWKHNS